ncbi:sodium/glutamate symporter [Virgibacillus pantothenticus]|uniref:Sodium:glutamate symporter n=1 Tax=Virgibacillus pantothenticus TaxID=1473 RepID=A0A0L0QN34_VIRPA|nr:sodium/glutamate symporter [Virgibacillus pantothenticus]KNE19991.1 sodium:glutamate symporter [Virgibacillus pantothenticus]MED3739378.1 sodium/glutamate symporter [Virgibacillus pantothenticus]QTY18267.1 sodium:glutamate symporter [Virgibacillus pantothenticus]SIS59956.1 glutamate:Na+ symporter, ESS family [Virgibacillus pantothenticus]
MTANQVGFAFLYVAAFLLLGKWVRIRVSWLQNLFLPSSIIGGFLALILGPQVLGKLVSMFVSEDSFWVNGIFPESVTTVWSDLPGLLINVVFASLFLGASIPGLRKIWNYGGPQLAFGWTIGWGQYVIGILLAILVLSPVFGLPPLTGALIEVAFEGGHGTAAGLAGTFEEIGFAEGYDLSVGLATIGILSGVIVGIILINWAVRKGKTNVIKDVQGFSDLRKQGIMEFENRDPAAKMTVRPESIEPLSLHFALVGLSVLVGYLLLQALIWLESIIIGPFTDTTFMTYIPLFPLAMIGGILVQLFFNKVDNAQIVDRNMINRIQGFALDILILTAIGTVSIDVISDYIVPFLLLATAGILWNVFGLLVLAPKIIPSYWFERGIGDFGQSMGITATGLLLMRIVDPRSETPAFEGFGYKQLVYEPFLGGGLVTALSIPLIYQFGAIPFLIFAIIMSLIGALVGLLYFGKR